MPGLWRGAEGRIMSGDYPDTTGVVKQRYCQVCKRYKKSHTASMERACLKEFEVGLESGKYHILAMYVVNNYTIEQMRRVARYVGDKE